MLVLAAALVLLLAGGALAPADAVPIRQMRVTTDATRVHFSATIHSPPTARHCYANVQASVVAFNPTRRMKALGNHRINVCVNGERGWTSGGVRGRFPMVNIREGRYAVCLRAVQALRNGRNSAHVECKLFYWRGG
jgi:hypothetical protein